MLSHRGRAWNLIPTSRSTGPSPSPTRGVRHAVKCTDTSGLMVLPMLLVWKRRLGWRAMKALSGASLCMPSAGAPTTSSACSSPAGYGAPGFGHGISRHATEKPPRRIGWWRRTIVMGRPPVVPQYMVRYSASPGAGSPMPQVRTARRRLVRVARTYSTEAPGRTCQLSRPRRSCSR